MGYVAYVVFAHHSLLKVGHQRNHVSHGLHQGGAQIAVQQGNWSKLCASVIVIRRHASQAAVRFAVMQIQCQRPTTRCIYHHQTFWFIFMHQQTSASAHVRCAPTNPNKLYRRYRPACRTSSSTCTPATCKPAPWGWPRSACRAAGSGLHAAAGWASWTLLWTGSGASGVRDRVAMLPL